MNIVPYRYLEREHEYCSIQIFRMGTQIILLFHNENASSSKHFLVRIFRTGAQTRGVNSGTWWEGELESAAVNNCKREGIISMVP